jgi:UDP-glucose 4-epimerase
MTTVLVTGLEGRLAQLTAALLVQQGARVVGAARYPLEPAPEGVETHVLGLRGAPLRELLRDSAADVVLHLAQAGEEQPVRQGGSGNVLTTVELLSACASSGVRRLVLRSSTLVYGALLNQTLPRTEEAPLLLRGRGSLHHDNVEIERFAAGFARKNPHIAVTVLRCAPLVGGQVSSPLTRYLQRLAPPTLLGYDPLIQVLHSSDAAVMLALAALVDGVSGTFNLAAEEPVKLSQAVRLAGRQPLPLPAPAFEVGPPLAALAGLLPGDLPFPLAFFRFACLADTRRAQDQLDFTPRRSAHDALRELAPAEPQQAEALA